MRTICLYFQIHQPFRLKRYRFFDIGNDHYYYDDYSNESIMRKVADKCYLPANRLLLDLIRKYPEKFKISFSISGVAFDQFELYAPDVLNSFKELSETGAVEFLAETNDHSLVALKDKVEFKNQVDEHVEKVKKYFNQTPRVFRNTELIYSDEIGEQVASMGYDGMLTEGAKHILGWKSPNYVYCNAINPKFKILLKNFKLSDDIAFRFSDKDWSEHPLTTEKFVDWLNQVDKKEETVNLFMDYETFGEHQWAETGIFDFLRNLPEAVFAKSNFTFSTPSEIIRNLQPVSVIQVPYPISWADEERDLTAWLGNEMQQEAFNKLYDLSEKIKKIDDPVLHKDWSYLQVSDHLYYMSTKFFSDGAVHSYFNPYNSPYDAFINYMNVLSDFSLRVNTAVPETDKEQEIASLTSIIEEKEKLIQKYEAEIDRLTSQRIFPVSETPSNSTGKKARKHQGKAVDAKSTTKKTAAKKVTKTSPAAKKTTTKTVTRTSQAAKKTATNAVTKTSPAAKKTATKTVTKTSDTTKKPVTKKSASVKSRRKASGSDKSKSS